MHCIILAGGFSTRLHPITKTFPKALLPIKGKAIVDYVYEDIRNQEDVFASTVVTNTLFFSLFKKHFANAFSEDAVTVLDNGISSCEKRSGAIGDLLFAVKNQGLQNEDLLVVASDTYTSLKMQDFIRFYNQFKGITTAVFDGHDKERIRGMLGCVEIKRNRIVGFTEKPENPATSLMAIPYYIFPKQSIPLLLEFQKASGGDSPGSFISWVYSRTPTYAYDMGTGKYFDIGTLEHYELAKAKI